MSDVRNGTLTISLIVSLPVPAEEWRLARGDTERKSLLLGEWVCTEATATKLAEQFRKQNPAIAADVKIAWSGPREL